VAGPDQFLVFDMTVRRRGRAWRWFVSTSEGKTLMSGSDRSRSAAAYQASRALFLLLSAVPCRVHSTRKISGEIESIPRGADGNCSKNFRVDAGPTKGRATGAE
jgi:hypothetical protein